DAYLVGTSLAYSDNGAGEDTITDSESRFLTAGFRVGDTFDTANSTTAGNDESGVTLTGVAAGTLSFVTGTLAATEAFEATTYVVGDNGGSLKEVMQDGIIHIYSGSQPADADSAETGTKLVEITVSSGAFTPGAAGNGLEFKKEISGTLSKNSLEAWSGVASATGTAGWFRFYDNNEDTGADATAVRFDGSVGTSGAQLTVSSTSITSGATITVDSFDITLPAN
ncbi:MAG: hypothetical protein U9R15_18265, partial [Chloroflexota bacterium]|nr:hypothetical protein [Chloroflexota bacterium]